MVSNTRLAVATLLPSAPLALLLFGLGPVFDVNGDVVVLNGALRSGFGTVNGGTVASGTPTPVPALLGAGRSLPALSLLPMASNTPVLFGRVAKTVRAVEFWAKSGKDAYFTATSGATVLGRVTLIPDRGWHRYVMPFSQDLVLGSPLVMAMGFVPGALGCQGSITDALCPVVIDALVLIARPFESVAVVSDNVFYAPTAITSTVSGRWSADPHFMSVTRVLDGAPACAVCTHVLVPASGALTFALDSGEYRITVETGEVFGVVGTSAAFVVRRQIAVDAPGTPIVLNANGDLVVLNGALRSGFRTVSRSTLSAATPSPVPAPLADGRSGPALGVAADGTNGTALFGPVGVTVRAVEFWAKSVSAQIFQATSGSENLGSISLIGDGAWHRYVMPFASDVASGSPLAMTFVPLLASSCAGTIADPACSVVVDSLVLIARPFETLTVVSDNSYYAPSAITATVAGRWSADPHFMSVARVLDGSPACADCTHVLVPASGALTFTLDSGAYRIVVETSEVFGVVGTSTAFSVRPQLPIDPPGTPNVLDANGDLVVLNGALRSGFRPVSGSTVGATTPTPVPAPLADGRSGAALGFTVAGSNGTALFGPVGVTVRAVEFWAKSLSAQTFQATSGTTTLGSVSLIGDGAWHRYVVPFSVDVVSGASLAMTFVPGGSGCTGASSDPACLIVVDSLLLVARPFETVTVSSNNSFYAPSAITATVSGRWSADPHFISVSRVLDGAPACAVCTHVAVSASGVATFTLDSGAYRMAVETGDAYGVVGTSATFAIRPQLPVDPPGTPIVLNASGDVVVLNGAIRSGFGTVTSATTNAATPTGAAAPLADGRNGPALALSAGASDGTALFGSVGVTVRAVEFWAKSVSAQTFQATAGSTSLGTVALIGDGQWHRYVMAFSAGVVAGSPLALALSPSVSCTDPDTCLVLVDSLLLITRPLETVDVVSGNSFFAPSAVTATVSGLWSADPHFMSVVRVSDGLAGCVVCSHLLVPVSGALTFTLDTGEYRVVAETGANFGVVGASSGFVVKAQLFVDPPGTPIVQTGTGDLVVLNGAFRSGFRTVLGSTVGAPIPTPIPAPFAEGRNGPGLALAFDGVDSPVVFGLAGTTVRAVEFWAKSVTAGSLRAMSGATALGTVALLPDGSWHRYVLPFPTDVPVGAPVSLSVVPVSAGAPVAGRGFSIGFQTAPVVPVVFDSIVLIARPFPTVELSSNTSYYGSSVVTATVAGLWSADPHYLSAMRTSDGSPACAACTHVLVPANGTFAFALDPGVYRIVLETTDFYATVGVSATFTINIGTTTTSTTSTTTTTTLPVFPVASNTVWNAYGEMVVLDDAFRSGFRMATGDAAATPIVARAAVGRVNEAVIFTPSTDTIRGVLSTPAVGLRFWAKVTTGVDVSVYALVGGSAAGMVSVSGDGQWAEYRLGFGYTRPVGQEVILLGNATGTATLLLDDMGFIIPPPLPPPTTATTTPAPTGHYESRVVLDWRNQLDCLSFQNIDGTGPIDYQCSFSTVEGSPPDFGWFNSPVTAENTVLASGATADDPYHLASYHTFTKMKTIQVWIEGPPTTTVPPPTLYPDWGVTFRQYGSIPPGNDTFSFETRFGNPPAVLFQNFTVGAGALQTVLSTGAIGDNPPYGNTFTHYTTVAPTTTTPPPTTTTTVVVTTTTIPTKPAAFSSYPNYLKSQLTGTCLTVGGLAGCDSGSQQLLLSAFPAAGGTNGYLVKQGSDCLTVNYDAPPDSQVQLPDSSYALKIDWLPCNSQSGGDTDWIPELADGSTGTDWFILMPRYNHPGIADPCLNLNTNPSSPQMLIEYTCHRQTTSTEEHWAPSESFWTPPAGTGGGGGGTATTIPGGTATTVPASTGTTTSIPSAPSGAHLFEDGVLTPLQSVTDLSCLTIDSLGAFGTSLTGDCESFIPELHNSSWLLHRALDYDNCLTNTGYQLSVGPCTTAAHWSDRNIDGLKFAIRPTADETMCLELGGVAAFLRLGCGTPSTNQLWYDAAKVPDAKIRVSAEFNRAVTRYCNLRGCKGFSPLARAPFKFR